MFAGHTLAEAEALERAAAKDIADRYTTYAKPQIAPGFMLSLIADYQAAALPKLAKSTQRVWGAHIEHIKAVFGETSLRAMQRKGVRTLIKRWHEGMADHPRTANYRLTVLSRILSWGVDEERLERNPAIGIERMDEGPGRAHIVWTAEELARLLAHCSPEVGRAVRLASLTGLRLGDVVTLEWADIEADVIRRQTRKSRRKQRASIPLYPALRDLLAECPRAADKVITNSRGRPWASADSFDSSLRPALRACGVGKHFHDLRGTAATRMFLGGLSPRQIALALGWSEREAEARLNDYVDLDATARALSGGFTPKPTMQ